MRKLVIILLCIAFAWFAYYTVAIGFTIGPNFSVVNYKGVLNASRQIDTLISQISNVNNIEFAQSKNSLTSAIRDYKDTKEEYETLAETLKTDDEDAPKMSLVDAYDVDFLWTTIGNYGTEEGIQLKFNVVRSVSSLLETDSYTMCDLKFTVSGDYIPITNFIFRLEDDNRLGFEISDFTLVKGGENLQATFTVKNVPINNENLIDISSNVTPSANLDEYGNPIPDENTVNTNTNTNTVSTSDTNTVNSNTTADTNTVN